MATLAPPRPSTPAPPRSARRSRARRRVIWLPAIGILLVSIPVALLAGAGNPPCTTTSPTAVSTPTGRSHGDTFAAPLHLQPGRWYRVGATQYGGPEDPTSGSYGSSGGYLPAHPDSFAELSLLDTNPANGGGTLTFQDANALGALPYGTNLRVADEGRERVLVKRDTGYGQGPGQTIPYRIDVWWQAASQLGISKTPVDVALAPATGSGGALGQLPTSTGGPAAGTPANGCPTAASPTGPLPITAGSTARIDPATGTAAAPASAPRAVKLAIAAANQIITKPYSWGGGHADLNTLAGGYDCSGSSEYALHHAGLYPPASGPSSTAFEHYYRPGPGRWITVYANAEHMWIVVAGIVLDTAWYAPVQPTSPANGPRWQPAAVIEQQIAGNDATYPPFSVTHPNGL